MRHGVDLDANQTLAKVRLAMVVLMHGDDRGTEIQAVGDVLSDVLWEEVEGIAGFWRDDLVAKGRVEIDGYFAARSEHAAAIEPLNSERDQQKLA